MVLEEINLVQSNTNELTTVATCSFDVRLAPNFKVVWVVKAHAFVAMITNDFVQACLVLLSRN